MQGNARTLHFPPLCVFFKLHEPRYTALSNLPEGIIPVTLHTQTFQV